MMAYGFNSPVSHILAGDKSNPALVLSDCIGAEYVKPEGLLRVDSHTIWSCWDSSFCGDANVNVLELKALAELSEAAVTAALHVIRHDGDMSTLVGLLVFAWGGIWRFWHCRGCVWRELSGWCNFCGALREAPEQTLPP